MWHTSISNILFFANQFLMYTLGWMKFCIWLMMNGWWWQLWWWMDVQKKTQTNKQTKRVGARGRTCEINTTVGANSCLWTALEDSAASHALWGLLPRAAAKFKCRCDGFVESVLDIEFPQCRAFHVRRGLDKWCQLDAVRPRERFQATGLELLCDDGVFSLVDLRSDEDHRHSRAVASDLFRPLGFDVFVRCGVHHREADQDCVQIGVAERSQVREIILERKRGGQCQQHIFMI